VVRVNQLVAGYGRKIVLDGISFDVSDGEVVGVLGSNGSGKSTLIRSFFHIAKVFFGTITLDDQDILKMTHTNRSRLISVQRLSRIEGVHLTVKDYVALGIQNPDDSRLKTILEEFDLTKLINKPISELSDGEIQRATLAQAVIKKPRLYLLDEPTAHLDLKYKIQMLEDIVTHIKDGSSAIAVIHDLGLAKYYCDKVVLIKDGKIFETGKPTLLDDKLLVAKLYGLESTFSFL